MSQKFSEVRATLRASVEASVNVIMFIALLWVNARLKRLEVYCNGYTRRARPSSVDG